MAGQSTKSTLWRVVVAIAAALGASNAWGLGDEPRPGETVTQYLTPEILQALFPGADKVGEVSGTPPLPRSPRAVTSWAICSQPGT